MVRLSASEQAAKKNTDMKADPGYADLYIPRKEGDPTGSSGMVNDLATGLTGTSATAETPEIAQAIQSAVSRPIKLGEPTKFPSVSNVNGLQTGTGNAPVTPPLNFDAFMSGLFNKFQDPIILEYFEQKNAAPQIVDTNREYTYSNKLKESDAL